MSSKIESNWWEFYGIRYAQGTVVGAMIVYFLFSQNTNLKMILFLPKDPKDFGVAHLILLAIYGLTYCYIASAPILVMHAGRGLLFKSKTNPQPMTGVFLRLFSLLVLALTPPIYFLSKRGTTQLEEAGALFVYSALVAIQVIILANIFHFRWKETIAYSNVIIKKREAPAAAGYVESYRHIREHGNSFLIVVLQFMLGIPIFIFVSKSGIDSEDAIRHLFLIFFIWILPAATIWSFGNKLENNLQYR